MTGKLPKWQPMLLILEKRLECACGALAIFMAIHEAPEIEKDKPHGRYRAWCQDCYSKDAEEMFEE